MENVGIVFGIIVLFVILFSKKSILFTHLDFFKKERMVYINILDVLIVITLTMFFIYPTNSLNKIIKFTKDYNFDGSKLQKIVLVFDTSSSMYDDGYLDVEKNYAKLLVKSSIKTEFSIIAFDGDYKVLTDFSDNEYKLLNIIDSLKVNMVNPKGGSKLRDTIVAATNMIKYTKNAKIILFSDGGSPDSDNSLVNKNEFKKMVKKYNIEYIGFGSSTDNLFYKGIFHNNLKENKIKKDSKSEVIKYVVNEQNNNILLMALLLLFIRIIYEKFNFNFNRN